MAFWCTASAKPHLDAAPEKRRASRLKPTEGRHPPCRPSAPPSGAPRLCCKDRLRVLDRLARSTSNLLKIAEAIRAKEVGLLSLAEPWADTISPADRMVLTVFAGRAEFERELIRHRTDQGP